MKWQLFFLSVVYSEQMVNTGSVVSKFFFRHLLFLDVKLAFFSESLHVIVHSHVLLISKLFLLSFLFRDFNVAHMFSHLILISITVHLSFLLTLLLSSKSNFKVVFLVSHQLRFSFALKSDIVSMEPFSINSSLFD